ncbi:SDR family NAD(P)-dependent oxidoreductase [Mariniflexile sp. AS56]|uniref:SDR family NAD(P)-dependent oxidoreductase n=1 Tax=Mariniflexile sp. AS56 TaxID=3063957 RepID=UPI0026F1CA40|nr:SDR family NAD(P)-dependent oxidoreductase [Mariniflexile sp. AS56]MDO7171389.1 SDR family NAD(P)-dependent oxidoreductase [Mariniflexile sp. AS56]
MNQATYNHINQLIKDSGVLHNNESSKKEFQNFNFSEETILITGAAGTIGSELARHILACEFKKMILVDIAESPLYNLIKEFEDEDSNKIECFLLNINDNESVEYLFQTYKPTLIFHAAAYKHVPLMESHPYEAVKTNILATKLLVDLAIKHSVYKFIFISTDKAVNPISVMGISKYVAECYIKQQKPKSSTQFAITRFGNIIGSNGSVLPLFKNQIDSGLSLTLTSKTITRYFIDKGKACHSILKIASFKSFDADVFTFNMGDPIKLHDLAHCFIDNYAENDSVEIKITALRPGEKHDEEIISKDEFLEPTSDTDILLVKQKEYKKQKEIDLSKLVMITPYLSPQEIKSILISYI